MATMSLDFLGAERAVHATAAHLGISRSRFIREAVQEAITRCRTEYPTLAKYLDDLADEAA